MGNGVLAARLLTGLITGDPPPWTDLYDPRRLHLMAEAGPLLKAQSKVAKHFIGDRLRSSHVDSVADIAPGTGAVVRVAGERCAVFRVS